MEQHHAYLVFGESLDEAPLHPDYKNQSADVLHFLRDRFSIDDARELISLASLTPFQDQERIFVIVTRDIAVEAQNALLKLFEEPSEQARFFVVIPKISILLPTLLSRMSTIASTDASNQRGRDNEAFTMFRSFSYKDRLAIIAKKTKDKDFAWIEAILHGAEIAATKKEMQNEALLRATLLARTYIRSKGASAKMLLEEIALQLPA